ncbi:MAG: hypothetical protein ACM37W_08750 [Actinomycetota bacterium]
MTTQTLEWKQSCSQLVPASKPQSNQLISKCAFCRHYKAQRGLSGHCHKLNAPVLGRWQACSLGIPPFAPFWENLEWVSR